MRLKYRIEILLPPRPMATWSAQQWHSNEEFTFRGNRWPDLRLEHGKLPLIVRVYYPVRGNCTLCHPQVLNGNYQVKLPEWDDATKQPSRNEGWQLDVDGVEVKACPAGVGGAASPFGAVVWSTMAPGVGFARLTNGSPAVAAASQRASSVGDEQQPRDAGGAH